MTPIQNYKNGIYPPSAFVWGQLVNSNISSSAYANGSPYIPIGKATPEQYVQYDLMVQAGLIDLFFTYAMSVANAGDVALQLDYLFSDDGDDPTAALTAQAGFILTPGNDALRHTVGPTQSSTLRITVPNTGRLLVKLTREDIAGDTHTGDMNIDGCYRVGVPA